MPSLLHVSGGPRQGRWGDCELGVSPSTGGKKLPLSAHLPAPERLFPLKLQLGTLKGCVSDTSLAQPKGHSSSCQGYPTPHMSSSTSGPTAGPGTEERRGSRRICNHRHQETSLEQIQSDSLSSQ